MMIDVSWQQPNTVLLEVLLQTQEFLSIAVVCGDGFSIIRRRAIREVYGEFAA